MCKSYFGRQFSQFLSESVSDSELELSLESSEDDEDELKCSGSRKGHRKRVIIESDNLTSRGHLRNIRCRYREFPFALRVDQGRFDQVIG